MDPVSITVQRMHHQGLWGDPFRSPAEVVRWLGAMQAQEFLPAKWGVAQRAGSHTESAVDRALDAGEILRTHVLRPTWHFVAAADIRPLLLLTATRVHTASGSMYRRLGLDADTLSTGAHLLVEALSEGNHKTRRQLGDWLQRRGVMADGMRLGYLMMWAELEGLVCSGVREGKQHTYALLDERVPPDGEIDYDEALTELTRRYFTSRGPATLKDYSRWSSLTVAQARRGLELAGDDLERNDDGDRVYWSAPGATPGPPPSPRVGLVQGYDECVMSYSESRDVLLSLLEDPPKPTAQPPLLHAILRDGRLVGHWKHTISRGEVMVETFWHQPIGRGDARAMDDAVARFGSFLEVPARWR